MKQIVPFLLAAGLLASSGCISTHVVKHKARPHVEYDREAEQPTQVEGQPGYYALLPLTLAGDVATSPFQVLVFLFTDGSHSGVASIHGVPIPLP